MARIGLDLDGVLYDFAHSLRQYLVDHGYGDPEDYPPTETWTFYEQWGMNLEEFKDFCDDGVRAGYIFNIGGPIESPDLWRLRLAGHKIHVVTDRSFGNPGESQIATVRWLQRHGFPFDSITYTADKAGVRLDYLIDDKVENVEALLETGCKAYLRDQPWNRHATHLPRLASVAEYIEEILK